MATNSGDAEDDYDFSKQPTATRTDSGSSAGRRNVGAADNDEDGEIPKNKRIACVICRKRKLKCDGNRPKCATCARLKHNCAYDEVRKKSGPKRGYVKELEARLAQVEAQVKSGPQTQDNGLNQEVPDIQFLPENGGDLSGAMPDGISNMQPVQDGIPYGMGEGANASLANGQFTMPNNGPVGSDLGQDMLNVPDTELGLGDDFSWEMIGLGLEEPMPTQEAIDELNTIYFDKFHPSIPMIHRYRFLASLSLSPQARPPICLRYIMWAHAASITDKYMHHADIFYRRARKYAELDEMKGAGEAFVSVAHTQAWALCSAYEFKMMYFPRAWMSTGRASRMALMLGLNRSDGVGLDVKQCLPPPRDWTEREERRRTFWMVYCCDRYASIGTGWPMCIDGRDIKTNLPSSEEAFENSVPQKTPPLNEAMTHEQVAHMSSLAGVVYVTHFFGLNLTHLHRPEENDGEDDLQGPFWKRHRKMDNILMNTSLSLPSHLRLPTGVRNPNIVFLNFAIHAATICLHQAAIFKAEKNQLARSVIEQSRARCVLAASEIASIMRMTSHLDVAGMNPFMAFCLYVAARVFVQYLKKNPTDEETRQSMEFLLTAMSALKRKNPLVESFMVQLSLDIQGSGLDVMLHNPDFSSAKIGAAMPEAYRDKVVQSLDGPQIQYCPFSPSEEGGSNSSPSVRDIKTPSIRSDSPRQTQYALRNIELQARESRQLPTYYSENVPNANHFQGSVPGQGWNARSSNDAPVGLNPLVNNNININGFDIEMGDGNSFGNSNGTGTSNGLTPNSSTTYPSNSSTYSPPHVEEDNPSSNTLQPPTSSTTFSSPKEQYYQAPSFVDPNGQGAGDMFKTPMSWSINDDGTAAAAAAAANFPAFPANGDWEKMMQEAGMGWDPRQRTGMTPR